jgi:N-acyl amino acid synthase of PEP-CTERM/exosortase system
MTEAIRTQLTSNDFTSMLNAHPNSFGQRDWEQESTYTIGDDGMPLGRRQQQAQLAKYFSHFFTAEVAHADQYNISVSRAAMNIRHQVFCEELELMKKVDDKFETDQFDSYSSACVVKHARTHEYAGTLRIIKPDNPMQLLQIEKNCLDVITNMDFHPSRFPQDKICEISRLAVPEAFRKKTIENEAYTNLDLQFFPMISVGLYLTAMAQILKFGTNHVFIMVEPRLVRNIALIGVKFKQIGPVVDYIGKRAPFYIDANTVRASLAKGYHQMLEDIEQMI